MKRYALFCLTIFVPLLFSQDKSTSEKLIDLGRVQEGTSVKSMVRFVNSTGESLSIKRVKSSCGCTAADVPKQAFAPGDTATIPFLINTRGFRGVVRKTLTVHFHEKDIKPERFVIQANVFSELNVEPRYLTMMQLTLNPDTTVTEYFTIKNDSEKLIRCEKIYTTSDMVAVAPEKAEIPPGKEHLIRVEVNPMRTGHYTMYVHVQSDHPLKSHINVPIFAQIRE